MSSQSGSVPGPKRDPRRPPAADVVAVARITSDGRLVTDTYWGGEGRPDGPGHAHAVLDEHGRVLYLRESERDLPGRTRAERIDLDDRTQSRTDVAEARYRLQGKERNRKPERDRGR